MVPHGGGVERERGGMNSNQDDADWKFQTQRGINLYYEMLCETTSSDNEEK